MKIFNRILLGITVFLFAFFGIFTASISISSTANKLWLQWVQTLANYLNQSMPARISLLSFGIFLLAIAILTVIANIESKRSERTVVLQSPHGEILVSLSAIEDFSKVVKNEIDAVKEIKGRVLSKRKGLTVIAKVTLYSDKAVAETTQAIQESIIRYIQYTLGIEAPVKPTVIVSKIAYRSSGEEAKNG
ncbi:MAG TPA: alkaline shock response membrane anchor protein AmaP [Candidatus Goldiibacteriota bacterium]|nr:alkaline shock response membrane anchor protein AmaP [Candidatus Goldiibacteriota bacterium]